MASISDIARGIQESKGPAYGIGSALVSGAGNLAYSGAGLIGSLFGNTFREAGLGGVSNLIGGAYKGIGGILGGNEVDDRKRVLDFLKKISNTEEKVDSDIKYTDSDIRLGNNLLKSILGKQDEMIEVLQSIKEELELSKKEPEDKTPKRGVFDFIKDILGDLGPLLKNIIGDIFGILDNFKGVLLDLVEFLTKNILKSLSRIAPLFLDLAVALAAPEVLGIGAALVAIAAAIYGAKKGYDALNSKESYKNMTDQQIIDAGEVMKFMTGGDITIPEEKKQYDAAKQRIKAAADKDIREQREFDLRNPSAANNEQTAEELMRAEIGKGGQKSFYDVDIPAPVSVKENKDINKNIVEPSTIKENDIEIKRLERKAQEESRPKEDTVKLKSEFVPNKNLEKELGQITNSLFSKGYKEISNDDFKNESINLFGKEETDKLLEYKQNLKEFYKTSNVDIVPKTKENLASVQKLDNKTQIASNAPVIVPIPVPAQNNQGNYSASSGGINRSPDPGSATRMNHWESSLMASHIPLVPGSMFG